MEDSQLLESISDLLKPYKHSGTREELCKIQKDRRERVLSLSDDRKQLYIKHVGGIEKNYTDIVLVRERDVSENDRKGKYDILCYIDYMEREENRLRRHRKALSNDRVTERMYYGSDYVNSLSDRIPSYNDISDLSVSELCEEFTLNKLQEYCRRNNIRGYGRYTKRNLVHFMKTSGRGSA